MTEIYNLTNITTANDIYELTKSVNSDLTGSFLSLFILLGLFIIILASMRGEDFPRKISASGFITTIIAILFNIANLTTSWVVGLFIVATSISVIIMYFNPT